MKCLGSVATQWESNLEKGILLGMAQEHTIVQSLDLRLEVLRQVTAETVGKSSVKVGPCNILSF
jgi:hypothetical protein